MPLWNKNSNYGQSTVALIATQGVGKIRVVGDSGTQNRGMLQDIFGIDPDGEVRFFSTIQAGVTACTANAEDIVYVMPGHTETITSQINMDVAGVKLIGLGSGSLQPTITVNGAIDGFDVSVANVTIQNIGFAVITTDLATAFINVDAAFCTIKDIYALCDVSAVAVVDAITLTANADNCLIDGVEMYCNGDEEVNSFLSFEGTASRVTVRNFYAFGNVDTAGVIDAGKINYLRLENVTVCVVGTTKPAITLDSNPEGMALNCNWGGTHATIATTADLGNLMRIYENRVTEETNGSVQGGLFPVRDTD